VSIQLLPTVGAAAVLETAIAPKPWSTSGSSDGPKCFAPLSEPWEIVAPILQSKATLSPYRAGTWGPDEADRLIAPRSWRVRARGEDPVQTYVPNERVAAVG
jgi:hypothetical protein